MMTVYRACMLANWHDLLEMDLQIAGATQF